MTYGHRHAVARRPGGAGRGAGASSLGDQRRTDDGRLPTSVAWMTLRVAELFSGDDEPPPDRAGGAVGVPVLLVACRATGERETDEAFARVLRTTLRGDRDGR